MQTASASEVCARARVISYSDESLKERDAGAVHPDRVTGILVRTIYIHVRRGQPGPGDSRS